MKSWSAIQAFIERSFSLDSFCRAESLENQNETDPVEFDEKLVSFDDFDRFGILKCVVFPYLGPGFAEDYG